MVCGGCGPQRGPANQLDSLVALVGASIDMLERHKVDWARLGRKGETSLDVVKSKSGKEKTVTSVNKNEGKQIVVKLEEGNIVSVEATADSNTYSLSGLADGEHVTAPEDFPTEDLRTWQKDLYMLIEGL